ncbi:hypothetical protein AX774_g2747 [Zancudomyces culisetae]|uniref:Uncharacterized protein n=1 Tax=Zancudomyces culisetae TaxID=1213189 RepID=A0A1R1PS66_ZANCU|nr:hypothetical protein AX774_g2747 [Zancudomyces culisetae]|eukprot:OMH83733.1 hypothetical protein AX774_g2747 [Zancudomyces culisetae]
MRPDPYKQKASRNYKKNNPESKDADSNPKPIKNNSQKEKNSSKIKDTPGPQVERSESKPSTNKLGVSKAGPGNQIGNPKSKKREIVDNSWRYLEQEEESEDEINAEVSALLKYFDEKKNGTMR